MAAPAETSFSPLLHADSEQLLPVTDAEVIQALPGLGMEFSKAKSPNTHPATRLNLLAGVLWLHAHKDDLAAAWPVASDLQQRILAKALRSRGATAPRPRRTLRLPAVAGRSHPAARLGTALPGPRPPMPPSVGPCSLSPLQQPPIGASAARPGAPLLRLVQHQAAGLRRVRQRLAVLGKPSPPAPPPPLPHCFRRQNRHPLLLSRPLPPTPLPPSTPRVRHTVGPMRAEPCGQPASPPVAPPERRLAGGSPRPAAGPQLAPARRVT
jgi:hypothetical protein